MFVKRVSKKHKMKQHQKIKKAHEKIFTYNIKKESVKCFTDSKQIKVSKYTIHHHIHYSILFYRTVYNT